jgi:hypothetical protein
VGWATFKPHLKQIAMPQSITPNLSVDTASQLAKAEPGITNKEPGFANTYGPGTSSPGGILAASLPALGVGGLSLLMMYKRYLQDQEDQKKQLKQADFTSQLPGLHPKDILLGAALGGGAGLLYDTIRGQPAGKRLSTTLKRVLTGAGVGAVGANVVGDRARRYITNSALPFGYDQEGMLSQLAPRSGKHVYDALIADKPSYDPKVVAGLKDSFSGDAAAFDTAVAARYELGRRALGVHTNNAIKDFWQKNKGKAGPDYYSVNEKNPAYSKNVLNLYRTSAPDGAMPNGRETVNSYNKSTGGWRMSDALGANTLLGEQQVVVDANGQGRVLDRYDVTPAKKDTEKLVSAIKNLDVLKPSWHKKPHDDAGVYDKDKTNQTWLTSLLGRMFWDKVLTEEHPWVSQRFQFTPDQRTGMSNLELLRESGKPST